MRMWMLPPEFMCMKHIVGEHGEIHKYLPHLLRGVSIDGRMEPVVQIQINALKSRHDELAKWMNHNSPLEFDEQIIRNIYPQWYDKKVNKIISVIDLVYRCRDCGKKLLHGPAGRVLL